ncbi:MAG TPA: hydrogen peroxide-inducible genes activator [Bradyrhizobium sp.]|nr:hydrogen peroxide-inducible genes activator [Bradyrhizobium sp.]
MRFAIAQSHLNRFIDLLKNKISIAVIDYSNNYPSMQMPAPTFRQLRFLVAVTDRRHFGQAARDCLVTQSTLSAGIQELEDLLGVRLLERTRRTVVPTSIGKEIAERAREVLRHVEDLTHAARAAQAPMSGPLLLGVIPTIGPFLVPRVMPRLREAFPKLKLYLREEQTARLLAQLDAGEIDAAILALPYPVDGVEIAEIGQDRFWVVCPSNHRLVQAGAVGLRDIAAEDLLLLEEGHCMRDHALAACSLEGARRNVAFQGTSLYTLVQMVANGLGVTLLPEMALDAGILSGLPLSALPFEGDMPFRQICLVWRRTAGRHETFRSLAEILEDCLSPAAVRGLHGQQSWGSDLSQSRE